MSSILLADNGVSSGAAGLKSSADGTGTLALQTTTASGTATTAVLIDNAQNVGVGVTPSAWGTFKAIEMNGGSLGSYTGNNLQITLTQNAYFNGTNYIYKNTQVASRYAQDTGAHIWYNAASGTAGNAITFTQAMTLDASGNFYLGYSSYPTVQAYFGTATNGATAQGGVSISGGGYGIVDVGHASGTASGSLYYRCIYNGSVIGSITQNGTTGVLYNLTSDYRLKNNQEALTGAKDFIMALKPKKWQWWDGSGEGVGFVAHEFMEVAKYSGHGEKDAVDENGKPVYQSIQPSSTEVMANLVSLLQEQQAIITQLQADVAALKGAA